MQYYRLNPLAAELGIITETRTWLENPPSLSQKVRPGDGIVLAGWSASSENGIVEALGTVIGLSDTRTAAEVLWRPVDITLRPNPQGRRWWTQEKPWFAFADAVIARYGLDDLFAEHFPDLNGLALGVPPPPRLGGGASNMSQTATSRPPTPGFVYVIRSDYGYKIGKTVNLKDRTRLFAVKLPFPISIEHYAWFDDYTQAERSLHLTYQSKRLEGEWFDLAPADLAAIKALGARVDVEGVSMRGPR